VVELIGELKVEMLEVYAYDLILTHLYVMQIGPNTSTRLCIDASRLPAVFIIIIPIVNTMRKKEGPNPLLFLMFTQHWTDDMTRILLSEVEKNSNKLVLLGKREKKEVSTCSLPFRNHPASQSVV